MDGIIIVDKPAGWTSFDVVAKVRNLSRVEKVGHSGTLDPMATGVLPVFLGKATKLVKYFLEGDKGYVGEMVLGVTTDTGDAMGKTLPPSTSGRGNNTLPISDFAAAYQHAICRHLIDRLQHAYQQYPDAREIHIVGGVSANSHLRTLFTQTIPNIPACFPFSLSYCTDNAAMIAAAGYFMAHEMKKRAFVTFETGSGIIA